MNNKSIILEKIESNKVIVGIIGLGYVGLPLAAAFSESGIEVVGFDLSKDKVDNINRGENFINDIPDSVIANAVDQNKLRATTDFKEIKTCDALLICVPTPLDKFRKPDMSHIESVCIEIGRNMKPGTFICLESTTYPTTTEEFMLPIIEAACHESRDTSKVQLETRNSKLEMLQHGTNFWLAYSPERVDPGNLTYQTRNTPKVLGALTPDGLEIGKALYKKAVDNIHTVSSPRVAEMVKILENTYRLVNISLINELALLAGKMDINIWEVIEAAKTKPFGFQAFYPGPGIGGHCIPLDPFYLEHVAKQYDFDLSMIHTAGHINMRMPHYMYIKIASALNRQKKAVNGSKVLFLGIAYKPDINDDRESPALEIIDTVHHKGGVITYNDPHIPTTQTPNGLNIQSVELTAEVLQEADVVVLTTNHKVFDIEFIQQHAKLIVDLRNMIKDSSDTVYKL